MRHARRLRWCDVVEMPRNLSRLCTSAMTPSPKSVCFIVDTESCVAWTSSGTAGSPAAKIDLYTVTHRATRAYAWTMAHTAVSGEALALGSASFAPSSSRWTFLRPSRANTVGLGAGLFTTVDATPAIACVRARGVRARDGWGDVPPAGGEREYKNQDASRP